MLPRTAQAFLSAVCGLSVSTILESWSVFKDLAWGSDSFASLIRPPLPIFHQHGIPHGYSMSTLNCRDATHPVTNYLFAGTRSLYPPSHFCQASSCPRTSKGMRMMQAEQRQCILYTLASGPCWSISYIPYLVLFDYLIIATSHTSFYLSLLSDLLSILQV